MDSLSRTLHEFMQIYGGVLPDDGRIGFIVGRIFGQVDELLMYSSLEDRSGRSMQNEKESDSSFGRIGNHGVYVLCCRSG